MLLTARLRGHQQIAVLYVAKDQCFGLATIPPVRFMTSHLFFFFSWKPRDGLTSKSQCSNGPSAGTACPMPSGSTRLMIEQDEIWQHTGEIRPIPRSLQRRSAILSHLGFDQAIRDFNIIG